MKKQEYTDKQGQYLSFIYYYIKLNGIAPAEKDIQNYFRVTPPTVNSMVKKLEELKYIYRIKGKGRSIKLLIERSDLPDLD